MLNQLIEALQLHKRSGEKLNVPTSLEPVVADLRREFTEPAYRKGITLRVANASSIICSQPVLLTSILRNLVRNAIDYTPPGGIVTVTSRQRGPELSIEVCDTGAGIRTNILPQVFSAFQRGDQSQAGGLGLGLFIVKRAVDLLGHRIDVHSAEGVGSRFTVVTRVLGYRVSERSGPKAECRRHRSTQRCQNPHNVYAACA
jgi:signal transduction histidine kinase